MTSRSTAVVLAALVMAVCNGVVWAVDSGRADDLCVAVDIDRLGFQAIRELNEAEPVSWWLEVGDELLLCGGREIPALVRSAGREVLRVSGFFYAHELSVARGRLDPEFSTGHETLAACDHLAVVVGRSGKLGSPGTGGRQHKGDISFDTVRANSVLLRLAVNGPPREKTLFAERVGDLVAEVDSARWYADVVDLADFNRFSLGPGIFEAEDWLVARFQLLPGATVTTVGFSLGGRPVYNVMATLPGRSRPDEWVIVGGHYDAISEDPDVAAPGAEDNASGCAGVLELARVVAAHPPESTVVFVCYAGEEQGLRGSEAHVSDLFASGDAAKVKAMLNMDMIGYTEDGDLDCLLESRSIGQFMIDAFSDAAGAFTSLRILTTLHAWGSDHVPFLDQGIPALLTIENDWNHYPHYHRTTDLPHHLSPEMANEILKMNVAALAILVDSGTGYLFSDGFESGDLSRWSMAQ